MTTITHNLRGALLAFILLLSVFITSPAAEAKSLPPVITDSTDLVIGDSVSCPNLTRSLSRGMRDERQVRALQSFLATHYSYPEADLITGYFGPTTEGLVRRFQSEAGVPTLGMVGPLTRAAIGKACGASGPGLTLTSPKADTVYGLGDDITVTWNTTSTVASTTGMFVQLVAVDTKEIMKSEFVEYASGTATLSTDEFCNGNFSDAIFGGCENIKEALKEGKLPFRIYAALYTPKDTCFGFCASTSSATILTKTMGNTFHIVDSGSKDFSIRSASGSTPFAAEFLIGKEGEFSLDFGDGKKASVTVPGIRCITTPCNTPVKSVPHTYTRPGTYAATLTQIVKNTCEGSGDTVCAAWYSREEMIGTITVEVKKR
ncbi:peptidoglycan-binding protein [Patescibacteria group bacterium]|nr:peptidoglycan-binding protein [Patescibacteria group bacterium]